MMKENLGWKVAVSGRAKFWRLHTELTRTPDCVLSERKLNKPLALITLIDASEKGNLRNG